MSSLKGFLYIILLYNHSFHFLTVTPPTLHPLLQIAILPFLSFFNYLYQQSLFHINGIHAEPLFSLISHKFACVGCRCTLITEDDGAYCQQSPVQSGSPSAALHKITLSLSLHMQGALPSAPEQLSDSGRAGRRDRQWLSSLKRVILNGQISL